MTNGTGARPVVAAFDFDGTVSNRDNVVPFCRAVAGTAGLARAVVATTPKLVAAKLDDARRDEAKAALTLRVFGGRAVPEVAAVAAGFAHDVIRRHLHPALLERARWHREQGHRLVFVSASFRTYLELIADHLGFDGCLATDLVAVRDHYTGELAGPNVRGVEKVTRLEGWLAAEQFTDAEIHAYGDSRGDRELLDRADHAYWIRRGTWTPA